MPAIPSDAAENWETVSQPEQIPNIREEDIQNFFLFTRNPLTGGKKNCKRHLDRAVKFGQEQKYIGDIGIHLPGDCAFVIVKANVRPSMKKGQYIACATLSKDTGMIMSGRCNCKIGALGVCAHIGGMLFRLVALKNPCTSLLCNWSSPPLSKQIEPQKLFDINWWPGKSNPAKPWPYV